MKMDSFSVEDFVRDPTLRVIHSLKKSQLIDIAKHYKLEVDSSQKKGEVKRLLVSFLTDEEIIPEDEAHGDTATMSEDLVELKRLELQDRERERENQLRIKELEIREKELTVQLRLRELETPAPAPPSAAERPPLETRFDISKQIRFVPPFQEQEVDKYFLHFEKIATSLEWPREMWTLLLQSVLIGKAREVYSSMSVEESSQYQRVKGTILKAYELVPEAYRQHFRSSQKKESQTYTEFAREKEVQFDRWCSAKEIAQDFNRLRQLILLEEFKSCLPPHVKTYLDERRVENLSQAAVLADDYSLTRKTTFTKHRLEPAGGQTSTSDRLTPATSRSTHNLRERPGNAEQYQGNGGMRTQRSGVPVCFYCKRKGHIISECRELEKKRGRLNPVNTIQRESNDGQGFNDVNNQKEVNPFISETDDPVPVRILRDTGATQSLLVEDILPLSETTYTGAHVLIQGVELGVLCVPLHKVSLESDLVSRPVVVGVRPMLPIQGVSLILGNDLAGGKVVPDLQVVNEQESIKEGAELDDKMSDVFPACAITRAMGKSTRNKDSGEALVNLGDTFLAHADDVPLIPPSDRQRKPETQSDSMSDQNTGHVTLERDKLIMEQKSDPELVELAKETVRDEEVETASECYFMQSGVLMRKWRPRDAPATEEWKTVYQIVVPKKSVGRYFVWLMKRH